MSKSRISWHKITKTIWAEQIVNVTKWISETTIYNKRTTGTTWWELIRSYLRVVLVVLLLFLVVYKTFLVSDNIIVFLTFKLYIIMLAMLCIACGFLNINVH